MRIPLATVGRALVIGGATSFGVFSCGGRGPLLDLGDDAGPDAAIATATGGRRAARGGARSDAGTSAGGIPSGGAGMLGSGGRSVVLDATSEAGPSDAETHDVSEASLADALLAPDCTCPPDDYFIDVEFPGAKYHLVGAYPLDLYCTETTVQMEHPPCSTIYSLTGCAGDAFEPPCLYLAMDVSRGPLNGFFVDPTGQTWEIATLSMQMDPFVGRRATGTFEADFRSRGEAGILSASGSFRACASRHPACRP
ncbi:MAG TPA: hypothetical protein VHE30_19390 [Polyangiaceae bacterium]|nr:hypothetical protein [Polyangiaceae bacterium]